MVKDPKKLKNSKFEREFLKILRKGQVMCWLQAEARQPKGEKGCWTEEVVTVSNFGKVTALSYYNGDEGGCWQRPEVYTQGEHVEWWQHFPV